MDYAAAAPPYQLAEPHNLTGDVKKLRNARKGKKADITGSIAIVIRSY